MPAHAPPVPTNTCGQMHTYTHLGPTVVVSPRWGKLHPYEGRFFPHCPSSSGSLLAHTHMDTHVHTQFMHTQSRGKRKGPKKVDEEITCAQKAAPGCGEQGAWGARSRRGASWLPLFPSQQPKVSPGGSATCGPSAPVGSCEPRTKASSTHHCPPEPSLVLEGARALSESAVPSQRDPLSPHLEDRPPDAQTNPNLFRTSQPLLRHGKERAFHLH